MRKDNKMLRHTFSATILSVGAVMGVAEVQAEVPARLVIGSIKQVITDKCYVGKGHVAYERNLRTPPKSGTKSILMLSKIFVGQRDTNTVWDLHGLAIMKFSNRSNGFIEFKETGFTGQFSEYAERRQPSIGRVDVSFLLKLPDQNCTLPISLELEYAIK